MAVTEVQASLLVFGASAESTSNAVTEALGLAPTRSYEIGDPGVRVSRGSSERRPRTQSAWIWDEDLTESTENDFHGVRSLDLLAERFEPHAETLALLSECYDIKVIMMGSSDSEQGGFFVSATTMKRLGRLSADFVPTVYVKTD